MDSVVLLCVGHLFMDAGCALHTYGCVVGELVAYSDVKELRNGSAFAPGDVLPPDVVKNLRRGYYAAVSHMDDQVGLVMHALLQTGYAANTIVSFWGE